MKKKLFWALTILYLIAMLILLLTPSVPNINVNDKVAHYFQFLIFAVLLLFAKIHSKWRYPYLTTIIVTILLGLLTELIQLSIPGRTFSIYDLIADSLGAVSILIIKLIKK